MKLDPSLHKTLLAGQARAPLQAGAGLPPALQALLTGNAGLWHAVAACDLWQRAGFQPLPAATVVPAPCVDEPTCPPAAEQVLQLILRDIHPELLDNWLALAHSMGHRLPHSSLVPLLDMGMNKPALRSALAPLLGQRGQWLAAQNPAWSAAYGSGAGAETPEAHWQLGNLQQRRDALAAMRRADPAAAMAALEREWPQETADSRIALLPSLATGLNAGDEAFLERALDDKRKDVRVAAQQLLATLPGSQLRERCKTRLSAIFTLERKTGFTARLGALLKGGASALPAQLTLQLPDAGDKAMLRDGIGIQKHFGLGEKAGWLQDLMGCVSPVHWSSSWDLSPKQVIDVLAANEFGTALITGLVHAAGRAVRADANDAALEWFVTLVTDAGEAGYGIDIVPMLQADMLGLPQPLQESIVQRWLGESNSQQHLTYLYALAWAERAAKPLSPDMSRAMWATARGHIESGPPHAAFTRDNFSILEKVLDASDLAYVNAGLPAEGWPHWPLWRPLVDQLMETLQFRHTMHRSFLEKNG